MKCSNCDSQDTSMVKKDHYVCNDCLHEWILPATAPLKLPGCMHCGGELKVVNDDQLQCVDCGAIIIDDENTEPINRVMKTGKFDKDLPEIEEEPSGDKTIRTFDSSLLDSRT